MNNSPTWGLPIEAPIIPQRYGREHNYAEEDKHSIDEAPIQVIEAIKEAYHYSAARARMQSSDEIPDDRGITEHVS